MGAVVVRNGNLIGGGSNQNRSHPRSKAYEHMIHAELAALLSAGLVQGTAYGDLYVVRITRGGAMATSKPCNDCMDLIHEAGISSIIYIDSQGIIRKEKT